MPLNRRSFLAGVAGTGAAALASACSSEVADRPGSAWVYTDDLGKRIALARPPRRVVAYVSGAAALWDFGVRPVATYGPTRDADGRPNLQAGNIDLDAVESVGEGFSDIDFEKLASLQPDLVLGSLVGRSAASRWVIKDDLSKRIEQICPVYSILEAYRPLPAIITGYRTLARRLGADVDAPAVTAAKQRFDTAGERLRSALAGKRGLRTQFVYAGTDGMYVASPKFYPTLVWYRQLGMTVSRQDDTSDEFLEQLSWEQVDRYPADLICTDVRSASLPPKQIVADYTTFARLPAVRAGQLGGWNGEPRFSYQQAVAEVDRLATAVEQAEPLGG